MLAYFLLTAAAAVLPKPGELKSFEDWAVGCDNVRRCTAVSLMEMESGENQLTIQIVRGGGRLDPPILTIANIESRKAGELTLVADGTVTIGTSVLKGEDDAFRLELSKDMIAKLRAARTAELRDAGGASAGGASLKGLVASLLYMDDRQGRTKTETALIASGDLPVTAVEVPPEPPAVVARTLPKGSKFSLTFKDMTALQIRTGCEGERRSEAGGEAYRIDSKTWLALVPCGVGAYNVISVPVLVNKSSVARRMKVAEFDFAPDLADAGGPPTLVNAEWDPATGKLSTYAKGRGLGDCGSAEEYVWDGRRFRLTSKVAMAECRGVIDWIPVWQAKVVRR